MPYKDPAVQKAALARWFQEKKDDPEGYAKRLEINRDKKRIKQEARKAKGLHRENLSSQRKAEDLEIKTMIAHEKENGCIRCPEQDPVSLDFHHLDPKTKEFGIAQVRGRGFNPEKVRAEIAKCVVLCKNCHSKFHAGRFEL